MSTTSVRVPVNQLLAWFLETHPGSTAADLTRSEQSFSKAREDYLKAHQSETQSDDDAPVIRTVVASVEGRPMAAYQYHSVKGRSQLRDQIKADLAGNLAVVRACIELETEPTIRDLSPSDIELLKECGSPEWQDFLARPHQMRKAAPKSE